MEGGEQSHPKGKEKQVIIWEEFTNSRRIKRSKKQGKHQNESTTGIHVFGKTNTIM